MSPTIPQPPRKWLLRLGLPVGLIALTLGVLLATSWRAWQPATRVHATIVAVRAVETSEPLQSGTSGGVIQAPGWVEPDPFATYVAALTQGVVASVEVLEGDHVTAGDLVATLVKDDAAITLQQRNASLAQRHGELASTRAVLTAAITTRTELVAPLRRIAVAKASIAQRTAEVAALSAAIAVQDATREALKDEHTRKKKLVEEGAVAAGPVVRLGLAIRGATARLDQLRADQRGVSASLDRANAEAVAAQRDGDLLIRETLDVEQARANVTVAEAAVALAEANVADAALALERTNVRSPLSGVVIERFVTTGSVIRFQGGEHAASILSLYDPKSLQVRADVPLADAGKVGVGQRAEITLDVLPDTVLYGEVTRFVHRADLSKNTIEAKVKIFDPSPLLKPDMLARVRLLPAQDKATGTVLRTVDRVFVPIIALTENGHVWVVEERSSGRGTAHRRTIKLGNTLVDGWREVISGLSPGDAVLTGDVTLREGEIVSLEKGVAS